MLRFVRSVAASSAFSSCNPCSDYRNDHEDLSVNSGEFVLKYLKSHLNPRSELSSGGGGVLQRLERRTRIQCFAADRSGEVVAGGAGQSDDPTKWAGMQISLTT